MTFLSRSLCICESSTYPQTPASPTSNTSGNARFLRCWSSKCRASSLIRSISLVVMDSIGLLPISRSISCRKKSGVPDPSTLKNIMAIIGMTKAHVFFRFGRLKYRKRDWICSLVGSLYSWAQEAHFTCFNPSSAEIKTLCSQDGHRT